MGIYTALYIGFLKMWAVVEPPKKVEELLSSGRNTVNREKVELVRSGLQVGAGVLNEIVKRRR